VTTYSFTPPTVFDVPQTTIESNPLDRLVQFYRPGERGVSVYLTGGVYTTQQPVYWEQVTRVFYGGRTYVGISAADAAGLTAAGFTVVTS
jgi:hypothetical protein